MAAQLDLPLQELSVENFSRAWMQFELVVAPKQWDEAKQLTILPTLLRERLLDYYVEQDALLAQGIKVHRREPLTLLPRSEVAYSSLSKGEIDIQCSASAVSNRTARVCQQASATQRAARKPGGSSKATQVEYTLNFDAQARHTSGDVNVVHQHQEPCPAPKKKREISSGETRWKKVCQTLEVMSTRLEALEKGFQHHNQLFGGSRNHQK